MTKLYFLLCVASLAIGCGRRGDGIVVVTVTATPELTNVSTLHGTAVAGTRNVTFDIHLPAPRTIPPSQSFGIDVPSSLAGTVSVHLEAWDGLGGVLGAGDGSTTLIAGVRADIGISLGASSGGADMGSGSLVIDHNAQAFGTVSVGQQSATAKFSISNAGTVASGPPMLSVSGPNLSEFQITTTCDTVLMPGDKCEVDASFAPKTAGTNHVAAFQLTATPGGSVTAALSGDAVPPGALMISPSTASSGSTTIGTPSATTPTFIVTNTGGAASGMPTVTTSDPQFVATGCAAVLMPGATCTVTVTFTPSSPGTKIASLSVAATPGGTATASLGGVGLTASVLSIAPVSYQFPGETAKGSQGAVQPFVVTNNGGTPAAALPAAALTTNNNTSFVIDTDGCVGMSLTPNGNCTVTVRFTPAQAGLNSTKLNIGPTASTLSGRGLGLFSQEQPLQPGFRYNAVWGSGPGDVYAGGFNNVLVHSSGNGTWTTATLTGASSSATGVTAIQGVSATSVYVLNAVGEMFNGSANSWTNVGGVGSGCANGMFVNGTSDIFCAGGQYNMTQNIGHWSGGTSITYNLNPAGGLLGMMRGTSTSNIFVVGFNGVIFQTGGGSVPSWAGQNSTTTSNLYGLFGRGIGDVWAVGDNGVILHQTTAGAWTLVGQSAAIGTQLRDVWEASPQELFVAGSGVILHTIDGGAGWEKLALPTGIGLLVQIWGSSDHDVYAVGEDGALLHYH